MPPKTIRAVLPNSGIKAEYQKSLIALIDEMRDSVLWWLRARYRAREDEIVAADKSPTRDLMSAINSLFSQWEKRFEEYAQRQSRRFARRVNASATNQLLNSMNDAGLTVKFRTSRRVNSVLQATIAENVGLITSIPKQYLDDVRGIVMRGVQEGRDLNYITEEIEPLLTKKSRNRAIMIARDQTNKATEAITRTRCEGIGITEGIWMHRSGSKVPRQSHLEMDGKRFKLDDGLFDWAVKEMVKPGSEINCHCTFRPVIPGFDPE